jgi:hypothetical protein
VVFIEANRTRECFAPAVCIRFLIPGDQNIDALSKIPTHFATSDAKSDYTLLSSHILSLGMKIYDAFQTPTSCVPKIKTQGEMLSCLKEKLNDSSDTQMHVSTAALVASAPKLECDTLITKTR